MIAIPHAAAAAAGAVPAPAERQIIRFPSGIPGFERCRSFVVLAADTAPLQWLQSVEGPPASFLVLDPRLVLPAFARTLSSTDLDRLGAESDANLLWLAIVILEQDGGVSVNLRAPIVINPESMLGIQMVPQDDALPLRFVIAAAAGA
jgi:flagellar assembly factor FliW